MTPHRTTVLASLIVLATGLLWGLYWLPVRALADRGLDGGWGTLAITSAACLLLGLPVALRGRLWQAHPATLLSIAIGGAAFTLYSIGLNYGRVAMIILLYFLTPVWSTLIGRFVMGWETPRLRVLAILAGLAGLAIMLGGNGGLPLPQGLGEWMALAAGMLWSLGTTGIRSSTPLAPPEAAFVFALGAALTALVLAPALEPVPQPLFGTAPGQALLLALFAGGLWWGLSTIGLLWATVRLDPARVGILLMVEVLIGALSAALLAGESLTTAELIGGALVLAGGLLELWPQGPNPSPTRRAE